MKILIACESSGELRRRFADKGHAVISCDMLPADDEWHSSSKNHFKGDVREILESDRFDMIIAHPPCTYLCVSGMHWTKRGLRDPQLTEDALEFVKYLLSQPAPYIAIENPVGVISTRIRKPDQYIQPYQFGDDASKKTGLWLKGLKKLKWEAYVEPRLVCCGEVIPEELWKYGCPYCCGDKKPLMRWGNQTDSGQNKLGPSSDRWKERSKTYPGIANAIVRQWGFH